MTWLAVAILLAVPAVLTVSMLRGGRLGRRWYTGGRSWGDRERDGAPAETDDNTRSHQWGGTTRD